jgi:hypothetical protein
MADNALAPKPLNALMAAYQRYIGQPVAQVLGGGVRGYFGLDMPEYADELGREVYRQAQALGNMPGVGAPAGAVKTAVKFAPEAAMFIGSLAKTFDRASNAKAIELEKAGVNPRAIWEETGNWRGPDGNWRQEISDLPAEFRTNFDAAVPSKTNQYSAAGLEGPIGGMFRHEDLYAAYPDLLAKERMTLKKRPDWMGEAAESGSYRPGRVEVSSKTEQGAKSKALHELQHALQYREGWQRGGSESMFGGGEEAFEKYRRLAGEAEARATQARMNLTPAQRRALFPEESYDIPLNQLILRR